MKSVQQAYEAGQDYARHGANMTNCHFSFFATPEHTAAWERGRKYKEPSRLSRLYHCDETESLGNFVFWMGRKLALNSHKNGWRDSTSKALVTRLRQELAELVVAIETKQPYEVIAQEAADVANFAMMIQDNFWEDEYAANHHVRNLDQST